MSGDSLKIGIIGSGAGAAAIMLKLCREIKGNHLPITVTCIHNPTIPAFGMGEVCPPPVVFEMKRFISFHMITTGKDINATPKAGNVFEWEDESNESFSFTAKELSIHIDSYAFSKYVLRELVEQHSNIFTEAIDDVQNVLQTQDGVRVTGANTYDFDYLIDCTGFPTREELNSGAYSRPQFETVNSVMAINDFNPYTESYTTNTFHKNGWMFGIPLGDRKTFGYLYNNTITSDQEASDHFKKLVPHVNGAIFRRSWEHYYRKKAIEGRIAYMGNKLFFIEPMHGLSLLVHDRMSSLFINSLLYNEDVAGPINSAYLMWMRQMWDVTIMPYAGDCVMDSPFWNYINQRSIDGLRGSSVFCNWVADLKATGEYKPYWMRTPEFMKNIVRGFKIDLNKIVS